MSIILEIFLSTLQHWRCAAWRTTALLSILFLSLSGPEARAEQNVPVDDTFFGLIMNRTIADQPWPSIPFGSWRLWDTGVNWPALEPQPGHWNFSVLDRLINEAVQHKVQPLLVLAHSPQWASARPDEPSAYRPGYAAEPANIEDWRNYVRTVAMRYKGRITQYQVWNEPSDRTHYTGTSAQLVQLTCEAWRILKDIDPGIKVVSAGSAGGGRHVKYLDDFLVSGGAACIDVVAHHFYVPREGPEAMLPTIREVRAIMRARGVGSLPLWSTEIGWWIANADTAPDHPLVAKGGWRKVGLSIELAGLIERTFLLARSAGVDKVYWYSWTNTYGWGLAEADGTPKPGVWGWLAIRSAMLGKVVRKCTEVGSRYVCELQKPDGSGAARLEWRDPDALVRREGSASSPVMPDSVPIHEKH